MQAWLEHFGRPPETPEEWQAFSEWQTAYDGTDEEVRAEYQKLLETEGPTLRTLSYDCIPGDQQEIGHEVDTQISESDHDGDWGSYHSYQTATTRFGEYCSGDIGLEYYCGVLYFENLSIPNNARIHKAILQFFSKTGPDWYEKNDKPEKLIVGGYANDCPQTNYQARYWPRTNARKEWNLTESWETEQWYSSVDISCVIQELVDENDTLDSCTIFLDGDYISNFPNFPRRVYDYSEDPTKAAKLILWWTSDIVEESTGGVVCDGAAEDTTGFMWDTYGGIVCDGTSVAGFCFDEVMQGGVVCTGKAPLSVIVPMQGGILAGGAADFWGSSTLVSSGGVKIGPAKWFNTYCYCMKISRDSPCRLLWYYFLVREYLEGFSEDAYLVTDSEGHQLSAYVVSYAENILTLLFKCRLEQGVNNFFLYW